MRTRADWDNVHGHTSADANPAPWAVVMTMAALVDDDRIEASWVEYKSAKPTTWAVFEVTTAGRLAYAELQFDAERYDGQEDQNNPIPATINAAWIRPLHTVVKLQIGKVGLFAGRPGTPFGAGNDWFPIGDIQLTFADGETVKFDFDQARMGDAAKRGSDDFLKALRGAINF
jgi:hypothetical protein